MKTADNRKEKIRELKQAIDDANVEMKVLKTQKATAITDKLKSKNSKEVTKLTAVITGLENELKLTRDNRNSSSFFSWNPTGMNRRMKRQMRKLGKKSKYRL